MPILNTFAYIVVIFICGYGFGNHEGYNITDLLSFLLLLVSIAVYGPSYILMIYTGLTAFLIFLILTVAIVNIGLGIGFHSKNPEEKQPTLSNPPSVG